jgi:hypothetical protein
MSKKAAAERKLSQNAVVILDAPNYIKGYRYELYCAARSLKTPSCVVHVATSVDTSTVRNAARDVPYTDEIFSGLVMRFEFPDDRQRWDKPLFTVVEDEEVPIEAIIAALTSTDVKAPNAATQSQPVSSLNTVHEVERVSQLIITVGRSPLMPSSLTQVAEFVPLPCSPPVHHSRPTCIHSNSTPPEGSSHTRTHANPEPCDTDDDVLPLSHERTGPCASSNNGTARRQDRGSRNEREGRITS